MIIAPGQTLLHYRILDKLGEGGMGEVWKAVDTTLDREVAIKVLPAAFSEDAERLARFEREAKLLAQLNHPNIAAVYSVHAHEGLRFLAMELVPGEDLAGRLERGPLPLEEAMGVALQIAEALETAHESGVVHRDLKPANVRRTPDGKVKVLDFGLAKALESATPGGASPELSPTITSAGTVAGMLLGTAAYMSPEQARGQAVDRRTDIWAFGCVLYELLTGRRTFEGDTVSDSLASILAREPEWDALPNAVPPNVHRMLRRCLDKDARTRLRDIGEARVALANPESAPEVAPVPSEPAGPTASRWPERLGWLALLVLVVGVLAKQAGLFGTTGSTGDADRTYTMRRLTELAGPELHPDLSPDGRQLIYTSGADGDQDVYLLRVGGNRAINLTAGSDDDDSQAKFSPDGERIVFRSERDGGGLFLMGATGESVRRLTSFGVDPCWSPDGRYVAFATEAVDDPYSRTAPAKIYKVELATGEVTDLSEEIYDAVQPAWSPDGKRIAFWSNPGGQRDLLTVAADGGKPVPVTEDRFTDWSPTWSPDGEWLYFSSDRGGSMNLWRVGIDSTTGRTRGEPRPVTTGTQGIGHAAVSSDGGRMVVMAFDRTSDLFLHEIDRLLDGDITPATVLRGQTSNWCGISRDGTWLGCSTKGAQEDLFLMRTDGSEWRRLTDDVYKDRLPRWTPDDEAMVFFSTRDGAWNYWWIRVDGSDARQLTRFEDFGGGALSHDGQRLSLNADFRGVVVFDVNVEEPVTWDTVEVLPLPDGYGADRFWPDAWSPDGKWLAGSETGEGGLVSSYAVYDLEAKTLRRLDVGTRTLWVGAVAGWLPDSRRLVLKTAEGISIHDTVDGSTRLLLGGHRKSSLRLSGNGKLLMVEDDVLDSEIWLLEFE